MSNSTPLQDRTKVLAIYTERRSALVRYFSSKTGSPDLADDIAQDIATRIMGLPDSTLAEISHPVAFLYRVGSNLMLDRAKSRQRAAARDHDWSSLQTTQTGLEPVADLPAADDAAHARQRMAQVLAIVATLRPQCRRAFQLHKLEGLSHAEVAEHLGISRSAVEKHISQALRTLLRELP
jgi:RNA polymerase sigma-70 factor (ECF subfamily)